VNIIHRDIGFPFIEIENFYDDVEMSLIWEEINFLYYDHKIETSYGSAEDFDGSPLKNNRCIYLDEFYEDKRNMSNILMINRKLFENRDKIFETHPSWFFREIDIQSDETSFSYYENDEEYKSHKDAFTITCLFWTFKQPKRFQGGKFIFTDYNYEVEVKNNKMLIFPSCIMHEVTPVKIDEMYRGKKMGRVCISNFLSP
jgi:Rps23 Pro-64 3,4-dihydroxylase Tpa1-like proline 4-hydroxylase